MRLAHSDWHFVIPFCENEIPVLVVERPSLLRRYIAELQQQLQGERGNFVLSRNWEPIPIEKHMLLATDVFSLNLNERKSINALYKQVNSLAHDEKHLLETSHLQSALQQWLNSVEQSLAYPVCYQREIAVADLLKAVDFRFDDHQQDITERLDRYLQILAEFLRCDVAVFLGLRQYFDEDEMRLLYRMANYRKQHVLLLEPIVPTQKVEGERWFILDKDLCELYTEDE